ncbi:MAG TPA: alpha/beta hydrolase, partial [Myxococcaceae bacterium]|nr:alpha/beta hydrolase [Myxococcaceae bacterium]
ERGAESALVVGHDWGGTVAWTLAMNHPEVVDRLAILNAAHPRKLNEGLRHPSQLRRSWYFFYFQLPYLPERLLSARGGALVSRLIRSALVEPSRVPAGRLAEYEANFSRPGAARAAINYYRQVFRGLLSPRDWRRMGEFPRIRAPFMLIWGEQDVALGKALTYGLEPYFEHRPDVRYLPDVGHFVPLEAPERTAALILEHLSAGRSARAPAEAAGAGEPLREGPQSQA